ncbi:hypothetical protein Mpt1_c00910 [Candidatus Methanoplasma termitum]|uniref:Uncharacterized protein n=1 Tax=Candidatus Methanoplasma termitum TaxID=1577791 RepID=A0A0A7LEP2_9ARCH|nr:InlB B-repeat-containing protein [Candidatus Methanoplasma termitum]AIZ55996.1 hypothetical protein Mpt1_c00910 [Candidatus Methanoplasma termitum]
MKFNSYKSRRMSTLVVLAAVLVLPGAFVVMAVDFDQSSDSSAEPPTDTDYRILSSDSYTVQVGDGTDWQDLAVNVTSIQSAIEEINTNAAGRACSITFWGDIGANPYSPGILDIGAVGISFNNDSVTWGTITLYGKVTSIVSGSPGPAAATVSVEDGIIVDSYADISNDVDLPQIVNAYVIYNSGTVNILGGTVAFTTVSTSAKPGSAYNIYNDVGGKLDISGNAVVKSVYGVVIYNASTLDGAVTIRDNALISSSGSGTAINNYPTSTTDTTLKIFGGTVENISTGDAICNGQSANMEVNGSTVTIKAGAGTGSAISNSGVLNIFSTSPIGITSAATHLTVNTGTIDNLGIVNIYGGTVENTSSTSGIRSGAIWNTNGATVNISGGIVKANAGPAIYNLGNVSVSGGTVTSQSSTNGQGTIMVASSASGTLTMTAGTVENTSTGTNAVAIYCANSASTVSISGGTVQLSGASATGSRAIHFTYGTLTMTNGDVKILSGASTGILINPGATANISGGTVTAITGPAIQNNGTVNISGSAKITSANSSSTQGTILNGSASSAGMLTITAGTVENTSAGSSATTIYCTNAGSTVSISGGTVQLSGASVAGSKVINISAGTLTMTNGDVKVLSGGAGTGIITGSTGTVNISGGTVTANTAPAISNSGTANVSGNAKITSANSSTSVRGTIVNNSGGVLNISGGLVENTYTGSTVNNGAVVILNSSALNNAVNISGGTVQNNSTGDNVANSPTIYNNAGGTISISETTPLVPTLIQNLGDGGAIYNTAGGTIDISGGKVTSKNANSASGTILSNNNGVLKISGGTVDNTSTATTARTISNQSTGGVNIYGGTIQTINGRAIDNSVALGSISISDALIQATGTGIAIDNRNVSGSIMIVNSTVQSDTGLAISNIGSINIIGGDFMSNAAKAIDTTGPLSLGGDPYVKGRISAPKEKITAWNEEFNTDPLVGSNVYYIEITTPAVGDKAVFQGASADWKFEYYDSTFYLVPSNGDLLLGQPVYEYRIIYGDNSGGTQTFTAQVKISAGSTAYYWEDLTFPISGVDKPVQDSVDAIKANAAGNPCSITFWGDGNEEDYNTSLDTGEAAMTFNGGATGKDWGKITLYGNLSGTPTTSLVTISNGVTVDNEATLANNSISTGNTVTVSNSTFNVNIGGKVQRPNTSVLASGSTITATGTATVNINGGYVISELTQSAIYCSDNTVLNIFDGTVQGEGTAVGLSGGAAMNISGGNIESTNSTDGHAIVSDSNGKITIDQIPGKVTTVTSYSPTAAVVISGGTTAATLLEIKGGLVGNASTSPTSAAISIADSGTVIITGGNVMTMGGYAIKAGADVYVELGGDPTINGMIYAGVERISVIVSPDAPAFDPTATYTIDIFNPAFGANAVINGTAFSDNFILGPISANQGYFLAKSGADIILSAFSITYDANGGTGAPATETDLIPGTYNLSSTEPTHSDIGGSPVLFMGWSLEQVGVLIYGDPVPPLNTDVLIVNADVTVYAVWGIDTNSNGIPDVTETGFSLIYDANGGTGAPATETDLIPGTYNPSSTEPTHSDIGGSPVLLMGWSLEQVGVLIYGDPVPPLNTDVLIVNADVTVYAVWGIDTNSNGIPDVTETGFSLIYDANGGTGAPATETDLIPGTYNLSSTEPTHSDIGGSPALFMGWSLEQVGILIYGDPVPPLNTDVLIVNADVTVYAVWGVDTNSNGIPDVTENTYSVTYDANGGTGAPAKETGLLDGAHTLSPTAPTHAQQGGSDVLFMGWSLAQTGVLAKGDTVPALVTSVTISGNDETVYAVWGIDTNSNGIPDVTENTYSVTYDANGGTGAPAKETGLLDGAHTLSPTAPTHAQQGGSDVLFMGWSLAQTGVLAKGDTVPALVTSVTISGNDETVYAVWGIDTNSNGIPDVTENTYSVTYDANGGTGAPAKETGLLDGAHTLSPTAPTHAQQGGSDVLFMGWSLAQTGVLAKGDTVPALVTSVTISGNDETVYAVWGIDTNSNGIPDVTENTYSVTYDANGGTGAPAKKTGLLDGAHTLSPTAPTHAQQGGSDVLFMGWSLAQTGVLAKGDTVPALVTSVTISGNDETVYAVWGIDTSSNGIPDVTENTYSVTYDANGGTGAPAKETGLLDGAHTLSPTAPTHAQQGGSDVLFMGWSLAQTGVLAKGDTVPALVTSVTISGNDETVYAVWGIDTNSNGIPDVTENTYSVTYDANGGTGAPAKETGLLDGAHTLSPTAPTHAQQGGSDVLFMGWSLAQTGVLAKGDTVPALVTSVTISGNDETVYAVWGIDINSNGIPDVTENTYSVTYDANGGTGAPAKKTGLLDGAHTLSPTAPTHAQQGGSDVLFMGWSLAQTGVLAKGDTVPALVTSVTISGNDETVYAVWGIDTNSNGIPDVTKNTYSVTYDANGGTGAPAKETGLLDGAHTLSPTAPTHAQQGGSDVLFMGWSLAQTGVLAKGDTVPALVTSVTISGNDETVYAVWGIDTNSNGIPDVLEDPNQPEHKQYTITATADSGSTITPSGRVAVLQGNSQTFTFKAKVGYTITEVVIDGLYSLTQAQIDSGIYTFTDVMSNHTIAVKSAMDSGGGDGDGGAGGGDNGIGGNGDSSRFGGSLSLAIYMLAIATVLLLSLIILLWVRVGLFLTVTIGEEAAKGAEITYRVEKDGKTENGTKSTNSRGKIRIPAKKNSMVTIPMAAKDGHIAVGLPLIISMENRREYREMVLR